MEIRSVTRSPNKRSSSVLHARVMRDETAQGETTEREKAREQVCEKIRKEVDKVRLWEREN